MRLVVAGTGVTRPLAEMAYSALALGGEVVALRLAGWAHMNASVEKVARTIGEPVDLIGHSQGGVVAALVASRFPYLVRRLVTIGAPLRGTPLARRWMPLPSARCMSQDSRICEELAFLGNRFPLANVLTIGGTRDQLVPAESALPWPCNAKTFDLGHLGLVRDGEVLSYVKDFLDYDQVLAA